MPIYEYTCTKCRQGLEAIQKFSDPPLTQCPRCGGRLEKQMSASAFHLKGSGWYKDGYASTKSESEKPEETKKEDGKDTPKDKADKKETSTKEDPKKEPAQAGAKALKRPSPSASPTRAARGPVPPPQKKKPGRAPVKASRGRSKK